MGGGKGTSDLPYQIGENVQLSFGLTQRLEMKSTWYIL